MVSYRDEIKVNVEEALKLLQAAKAQLEAGDHEAATSHASESAFHTARALLLDEGIEPAKHGNVMTLIQEVFVKGRRLTKDQGADLHWLFAIGTTEDRVSSADAHRAVGIAGSFIEAAKVILEG
jgi:uncharacterized protein (UPF0332 family)